MPDSIGGLPLHPLIVHATSVLVPLAALLVILAVCWPRFRAWAGPLPMCLSAVALILTPLSTSTGESLEEKVGESSLVEKHAELGDQLLPFTIALFVFSAGFWWLDRQRQRSLLEVEPVTAPSAETTSGGGTATLTAPAPAPHATSSQAPGKFRTATAVVGVLAVLAAVGTGIQVARIGHSGAKAAWSDASSAIVR
ncbi:DUF2231 domain-containing protein [Nocardioides sp.]|uniref:DUF2231 domain-containing protein n=1 Tax=Nocardioides sp. TaxID=35761 RepID=UPI0037832D41